MKNLTAAALCILPLISSCNLFKSSSDDTPASPTISEKQFYGTELNAENLAQLPACKEAYEAASGFVQGEQKLYVCHTNKWEDSGLSLMARYKFEGTQKEYCDGTTRKCVFVGGEVIVFTGGATFTSLSKGEAEGDVDDISGYSQFFADGNVTAEVATAAAGKVLFTFDKNSHQATVFIDANANKTFETPDQLIESLTPLQSY